jgi:hypothetical protein
VTVRPGIPVNVIIADAGPLISLAACGQLELLRVLRRPVKLPDVVKAECLRYPDKVGAATLEAWFSSPDVPAETIATPLLAVWQQAVEEERRDPESHASEGLGDATIAWLLRQIQGGRIADGPTLVLTEDGSFGDGVLRDQFPEVHVLSTRAFLRTLANFRIIPSAEAVTEEIANAGRKLARYLADRPGRLSAGTKTTWAEVLAAPDASGVGDGP